jgi:ABC-type glycerol-3-phosphate transport system permease component
MPLLTVFIKLIFAFIWAFVLGWLCKKGYKSISWLLVLLPFIVMFLAFFGIMRNIREIDKLNPMVN